MQPQVFFALPYYSGSHKYWADNILRFGTFNYHLETMSGRHWKWRMQGASIHLAACYNKLINKPDVVLCSTMMDVSLFKSLTNCSVPIVYYMHENQFSYPLSEGEKRDQENFHYGFINFKSCLASDLILFNSHYHKEDFINSLRNLLRRLPDYIDAQSESQKLYKKSDINLVGLDLKKLDAAKKKVNSTQTDSSTTTLLWNHRWDHDKNPSLFLDLCRYLRRKEQPFDLILLGIDGNASSVRERLNLEFQSQIVHTGYTENKAHYYNLISSADLLPVTSDHDFYGLSVLESTYLGVTPLLPSGKVYSEFIPEEDQKSIYYSTKEELYNKTISLLSYPTKPINRELIAHHDSRLTTKSLESTLLFLINTAATKKK